MVNAPVRMKLAHTCSGRRVMGPTNQKERGKKAAATRLSGRTAAAFLRFGRKVLLMACFTLRGGIGSGCNLFTGAGRE